MSEFDPVDLTDVEPDSLEGTWVKRIAELEAEHELLRAEIAVWREWYGAWLDYLPEGAAEQISTALREDD